jgi:hypothetical protein
LLPLAADFDVNMCDILNQAGLLVGEDWASDAIVCCSKCDWGKAGLVLSHNAIAA